MVFVISISLFEQIVKLYSVTYNCEIRKKKNKKKITMNLLFLKN